MAKQRKKWKRTIVAAMTSCIAILTALETIDTPWRVADASPGKTPETKIDGIEFRPNYLEGEGICFPLSREHWPSVYHGMSDNVPYLEISWKSAHKAPNVPEKLSPDGQWIREAVFMQDAADSGQVTASVDLQPGSLYAVSQFYNRMKRAFCVGVIKSSPMTEPEKNASADSQIPNAVALDVRQQITRLIASWADAWQSKDLDRYIAHYHSDFRSKNGALSAWEADKTKLFQTHRNIQVTVSSIAVRQMENSAYAFFQQRYTADLYRDTGYKRLELKKEGGDWKIYREDWFDTKPSAWQQ